MESDGDDAIEVCGDEEIPMIELATSESRNDQSAVQERYANRHSA